MKGVRPKHEDVIRRQTTEYPVLSSARFPEEAHFQERQLTMGNGQWLRIEVLVLLAIGPLHGFAQDAPRLERVQYNNPGLTVDLGVGLWAWPLPMDFDGDGDLDLVVNCPDKPYNGCYVFENPTDGREKLPVFKPGRRISQGLQNVQVSWADGKPRVLSPGREHPDFLKTGLDESVALPFPPNIHPRKVRANLWKYVDFDGDSRLDLSVGVGDWTDYGWDDAYDATGTWTHGPIRGIIYILRNSGSNEQPTYAEPTRLEAGDYPSETFGWPQPNYADFDGDGDLDLVCGEFLDRLTYFENIGSRTAPRYDVGRRLTYEGRPIAMDLQMVVPSAIDWDRDGDEDLVVGDEDGRVAFVEHMGRVIDGLPQFLPPRYFQQEADDVKFGALATPVGCDWDSDGDDDVICGCTSGYIAFFENLSGPDVDPPKWAAAKLLEADGETIRIQAGPNGSIQGPCEARWGYTTQSVADWDHDGRLDLIVNSIWGRVHWYRNIGEKGSPQLESGESIDVTWPAEPPKPAWTWWPTRGRELATEWRTTPIAIDWTGDGLCDLVMLDHEGYPSLFERHRDGDQLVLQPGRHVFADATGKALRFNEGAAGKSGRRKWSIVDWDHDGKLDLLLNSKNATLFRQVGSTDGVWKFEDRGPLDERGIEGHDTSPTTVDWNGDGKRDLLIGAEDGRWYYLAPGK